MRRGRTLGALGAAAGLLLAAGCGAPAAPDGPDPHSWSHPEQVRVTHLALDLEADFEARRLSGSVRLDLDRRDPGAPLVLDTRDLEIRSVRDGKGRPLQWRLGPARAGLGRPLAVELRPETRSVVVAYRTDPEAAALQWLDPEQTEGGRHPFLYSQSQSILARSWIPCQDTPSVRATYEATVRVPPPLMALMSAENPTEPAPDGVYRFRMPQPIPAYLMAIAAGELEFRPLGPRSGVYAEPEVVDRAAREFAETEEMMAVAESLYGPYRWGRYDILVLPPSFPFGGMENPRLTFVTPTVLAGDRSLTALVAHELAHSWSGNLVTNATWNDFWLNEGFTTYIEVRIMEALRGKEYADMLRALGRHALEEELDRLGRSSPDTRLALDLAGRDPDEAMTDVPYEKGRMFLERLERRFGRRAFDAFLRRYFDAFAFRPVTTKDFRHFLAAHLAKDDPEALEEAELWIDMPGLPEDSPEVVPEAFARVDRQFEAWRSGTPADRLDAGGWNTQQWLRFLGHLEDPVPVDRMAELDAAFHFTDSANAEILGAWLRHAVRSRYRAADARLEEFLLEVGRLKFLEPLYRDLSATEEGRARARALFERASPRYHPITRAAIRKILNDAGA
ncbi:MAG: M1 family peptidase [Acidobacteria bacterium]|nr:MAG: M1 family peptidase [Acidobacteriota bacterium]